MSRVDHGRVKREYININDQCLLFMTMPYIRDTLSSVGDTEKIKPSPIEDILFYVLSALLHLEDQDLINLDLKPDNIWVYKASSNVIKPQVIDLGSQTKG